MTPGRAARSRDLFPRDVYDQLGENIVGIVSVSALVCNARMRNWVFVRVDKDQPGLVGWGEATL